MLLLFPENVRNLRLSGILKLNKTLQNIKIRQILRFFTQIFLKKHFWEKIQVLVFIHGSECILTLDETFLFINNGEVCQIRL